MSLSYLSNGEIDNAITEFVKANRIKSDNYRIEDLIFEDLDSVRIYITDFTIFERMGKKNANLSQDLLKFSEKLKDVVYGDGTKP